MTEKYPDLKLAIQSLGNCYKSAVRAKLLCYKMASKIAGHDLDVMDFGIAQSTELESLTDFHVGVLLADDWGVEIPPEWLAQIQVIPAIPGSVELH